MADPQYIPGDVMTPYSTIEPLLTEEPLWLPEQERARIGSYQKYDELYWSHSKALKLVPRDSNFSPLYVPNPRTVVDSTAHFLLKDLSIKPESEDLVMSEALEKFLIREKFYSLFNTAKLSGVTRGDFLLHLVADTTKPEGTRLSLHSLDPASYFPKWADPLDPDKITGVDLIEQIWDAEHQKVLIRLQRYEYVVDNQGKRRVSTGLATYELDYWWDGAKCKLVDILVSPKLLPEKITAIPVYHFKNIDWQGQDFGSSELRGFERLFTSINQSASDEEMALALEGLGVYATDAPHPVDADGNEVEWEIAPAQVIEMPAGTKLDRVPGVGSIKPSQDHISYLERSLFEASSTFRSGQIDVQVAESGVALAIRFLPTLAKIETRDLEGVDKLQHLFFDWKIWYQVYENEKLGSTEIVVKLGDKLPKPRTETVNELNNMIDRDVIDPAYYREQMESLGYSFPNDMDKRVEAHKKRKAELALTLEIDRQKAIPEQASDPRTDDTRFGGNRSNNKSKPNESSGTEANTN